MAHDGGWSGGFVLLLRGEVWSSRGLWDQNLSSAAGIGFRYGNCDSVSFISPSCLRLCL